ncbi:hypothetical protein TUM17576_03200 [Enterobacter hormaechei]|nr:hypothetical protein TUM17576_03200 [Enterobacter hormaechei]
MVQRFAEKFKLRDIMPFWRVFVHNTSPSESLFLLTEHCSGVETSDLTSSHMLLFLIDLTISQS